MLAMNTYKSNLHPMNSVGPIIPYTVRIGNKMKWDFYNVIPRGGMDTSAPADFDIRSDISRVLFDTSKNAKASKRCTPG